MKLVNRLREVRRRNELTQEALAAAVGVTRQTIISLEKGRYVPSVKLALGLARELGLPVEDLFWLSKDEGEGQ
jgi:putative transcriptional regulator